MNSNRRPLNHILALALGSFSLLLATLTAGTAQAQDVTAAWNQYAGGNWSAGANWSGGIAATGVTGVAYFTNAITAIRTVTNDVSPWTINSLIFNSPFAWTISGGTITLAGSTPIITVNGAAPTLSSSLAGSAGLTKVGAVNLHHFPSAPDTFTGGLNVIGGQFTVAYPSAATNLIPAGNALSLSGGVLSLLGTSSPEESQTGSLGAVQGLSRGWKAGKSALFFKTS